MIAFNWILLGGFQVVGCEQQAVSGAELWIHLNSADRELTRD